MYMGQFLQDGKNVAFDHRIVIIIIVASREEFSKISNVANFFQIFKRG